MTSARVVIAIKSRITSEAIAGVLKYQSLAGESILCDSWAQVLRAVNNERVDIAIIEDDLVPNSYLSLGIHLLGSCPVMLIDSKTSLARLVRHVESLNITERRIPESTEGLTDYCDSLTARERDIFRLVVDGLSNKHIATKLFITQRTVKFHVSNILRKLKTQSRTEAVSQYLRSLTVTDEYVAAATDTPPLTMAPSSDNCLGPML